MLSAFTKNAAVSLPKSPDGWMIYGHISMDEEREKHYLKCTHDHIASEWP